MASLQSVILRSYFLLSNGAWYMSSDRSERIRIDHHFENKYTNSHRRFGFQPLCLHLLVVTCGYLDDLSSLYIIKAKAEASLFFSISFVCCYGKFHNIRQNIDIFRSRFTFLVLNRCRAISNHHSHSTVTKITLIHIAKHISLVAPTTVTSCSTQVCYHHLIPIPMTLCTDSGRIVMV